MKPGNLVQVLGKLDDKIREKNQEEIVIGTLDSFLRSDIAEVCVILPNNDLWIGMKKMIVLVPGKPNEKDEKV